MKRLSAPVGAALAVTCFIVACQGPASGPTVVAPLQASSTTLHHHTVKLPGGNHRKPHAASGALQDGGFESGGFTYWQQCGDVNAAITSAKAHAGTYSDLNGSASSEPNGYAGVCQQITIPTGGHLSFWVYEGTNETKTTYGDQEADLLDSSGNSIDTMFVEDANTGGWVQRTYDLSAYAGQSVQLFFGVYGSGTSGYDVYQYVDDVAWAGTATPTPKPTATPTPHASASPTPHATATPTPHATATPTPHATATPTAKPTATPTAKPTATPTPGSGATPYPTPPGSGPKGTSCGTSCGVERWHIKTLDDPQESLINWNTKLATVAQLAAIPVPSNYSTSNDATRYAPTETQVYRVRAILVGWKSESDHDFHMVIADTSNPSSTMIVEPPDPTCSDACDGGFGSIFSAVRAKMTTCFGSVPSSFTNFPAGIVADFTGVPLFDSLHGQTGVAPNGIELHALLDIHFISGQPSSCPANAARRASATRSGVSAEAVRKAYDVGRRLAAMDRAEERETMSELSRVMTVHLTEAREQERSFSIGLQFANTSAKTVREVTVVVRVTGRDGKRLGSAELSIPVKIAPGKTLATTDALRYVRFADEAAAIVESAGAPKTFAVTLERIEYTDGSDAGFDD